MKFETTQLLNAANRWRDAKGLTKNNEEPDLEPATAGAAPSRAEAADSLRRSAQALCRDHELLRGIERVVAATIGAPVRHIDSEVVASPRTDLENYVNAGRVHTVHVLEIEGRPDPRWSAAATDGRIAVFAKTGRNLEPTPAILNEVDSPDFRAPHCFGAFRTRDVTVEISEHVDGERAPFKSLPVGTQILLTRAIAGVNAIRSDGTPVRTRWLGIPLEWFEERCARHGGGKHGRGEPGPWSAALGRIRRIDAIRDDIKASIRGGRVRLFTHNDISPGNVFFARDGQVRIIDWEKATRSLPGADLRFLIDMKGREMLLDCYLARMGELGIALERDRVVRVIEVTEGFRRMRAGCANGALRNVESGLAMLETHFPP